MPHVVKLSVPMFFHWLLDCLTGAYISTKAGGSFFYSTGPSFVVYFVTRRMTKESVLFPVTIYQHSVQYSSQAGTIFSHSLYTTNCLFPTLRNWLERIKWKPGLGCVFWVYGALLVSRSLLPTDLPPMHSCSEMTSCCLEYQVEVCTGYLRVGFSTSLHHSAPQLC